MSIALAHETTATGTTTSTSVSLVSASTIGNKLFVSLSIASTGITTTVTGGGVASIDWVKAKAVDDGAGNMVQEWCGPVTLSSAPVVVGASAPVSIAINIEEWSGFPAGALVVDTSNSGFSASSSLCDPGSVTPTAGIPCLIVARGRCGASTRSPAGNPTGFTPMADGGWGNPIPGAYQIVVSASGSYHPTWTLNFDRFAALVVVYSAASGGGGGGQVPPLSAGVFFL